MPAGTNDLTSLLRARRFSFRSGLLYCRSIAEQWQRIHGATRGLVNAEVKMRGRAGGIAGSANVPEHRLACHIVAFRELRGVRLQVRVIIDPATGANYRNCLTSQPVLADVRNVTFGSGENGRAAWRENVLSLMQATTIPRRMPGVGHLLRRNILDRHGQFFVRVFGVELGDADQEHKSVCDFSRYSFDGRRNARYAAQNEECDQYTGNERQPFHCVCKMRKNTASLRIGYYLDLRIWGLDPQITQRSLIRE